MLAAVLGVFLVVGGGLYFVRNILFAPIDARISRKNAAVAKYEKEQDDELQIIRAQGRINTWKNRSLPPDAVAAQRLYVAWLTDLAQQCGLKSPKLTPDRRVTPNKVYVAVRVTVEATATFEQICNFVYRFRRTDLLHRIADLTIEAEDSSASTPLTIKMVAEGLSLKDAPPRQTLFPTTELTAAVQPSDTRITVVKQEGFPAKGEFFARLGSEIVTVQEIKDDSWTVARAADGTTASEHPKGAMVELLPVHPEMKDRKLEDIRALASQNPFAKPEKPKPPESPPRREEPKPVVNLEDPAAKTTKLISVTARGDEWQVCFYDPAPADKKTIVKEGSSFSVAGIDGTLAAVHTGYVLMKVKEETWRLELGKEVASMQKIDSGAKASNSDSSVRVPVVAERPGQKPVSADAPKVETPSTPGAVPAEATSKSESDAPATEAVSAEPIAPPNDANVPLEPGDLPEPAANPADTPAVLEAPAVDTK